MREHFEAALMEIQTGSYAGANFLNPQNNKRWFKETMQKNRKHRLKRKK